MHTAQNASPRWLSRGCSVLSLIWRHPCSATGWKSTPGSLAPLAPPAPGALPRLRSGRPGG
eukprot:5244806-Alexandrium_andersonii.AAC.1